MASAGATVMRATSVCCPRSLERRIGSRCGSGFTLLELLVVLALLATLSALVAPPLWRAADAARARGWQQDLVAAVAALPLRAFASGQALDMRAADLRALLPSLPADWSIELDAPLRYAPNGVAQGGVLRLRERAGGPLRARLEVVPLTGSVHVDESGDEAPR